MAKIQIPYKFTPRAYQLELFRALDSGYKRAMCVWHRRAGKDKSLWNLMIKKALQRKGTYYYFFPEYKQGKRIIWDGIDNDGFSFINHIPKPLIHSMNSQEMKIILKDITGKDETGSIIQIIGTDDYDKIRGSNPVGCVFSEFAYQNPGAWEVVRPIMKFNGGWAVFNSTPNGKNHMFKLWEKVVDNPKWFTQQLTVNDTRDPDGNPYVTEAEIQEDRDEGYSEEMIQQEYYCDWTANSQGFYYIDYLEKAVEEKRIGSFPYDPSLPVDTWWDIATGDNNAIWFTQTSGSAINAIEAISDKSKGLDHYVKLLNDRPYVYNSHNFPWDMGNMEYGTGRTRMETAEQLFGNNVDLNILPKMSVEDGINAARMILPRVNFDKIGCKDGLDALYNYHREWDDKKKQYKGKPEHDWSSDYADAFRYLALGHTLPRRKRRRGEALSVDERIKRYGRRNTNSWMVA